eukprot:TRINITY_DN5853_c0_g1_i4.p1 TRINITY_DN5853_c0_g1~~TRINITY_DN5853_c0_g1_i4.p1  ORF type:complete len:314 (-),score=51.62 TRINITY_DN5853_c0_g1_i4:58-999(-)
MIWLLFLSSLGNGGTLPFLITTEMVFENPAICDPVFGMTYAIKSLTILKVFKAKTKPILCEVQFSNGHAPVRFIFKTGDDLRRDLYVESIFSIFNVLWDKSHLNLKPCIHLYRVFPQENYTGFVEFVENSSTVQSFEWNKIDDWDEKKRTRFITSSAGAFVGGFVLGVRDRHRDNMLISDDGCFIHIDFGYLFNQKTWFDANRFAIPSEMKKKLTSVEWEMFLQLCGQAFGVLRRHRGLISTIIVSTFRDMYSEDIIMNCLSSSFHDDKTEARAISQILELARMGEASGKKMMKDIAHSIESNPTLGQFLSKS